MLTESLNQAVTGKKHLWYNRDKGRWGLLECYANILKNAIGDRFANKRAEISTAQKC